MNNRQQTCRPQICRPQTCPPQAYTSVAISRAFASRTYYDGRLPLFHRRTTKNPDSRPDYANLFNLVFEACDNITKRGSPSVPFFTARDQDVYKEYDSLYRVLRPDHRIVYITITPGILTPDEFDLPPNLLKRLSQYSAWLNQWKTLYV